MNELASELKPPAVLCLSGGMDSTSLLLRLLAEGHHVYALSLDYGQKHRIELAKLSDNLDYFRQRELAVSHANVDLSDLGPLYHSALISDDWSVPQGFYEQDNMKATVVPNRNAIFASIAYGYALSIANRLNRPTRFALGVHSGDHAIYPDCRPQFYDALMLAFELGNWDAERVELYLPYIDGDKVTILRDAEVNVERLGLDFDTVFRNTWTSYQPDPQGRADGRTGSDVERILAFAEIGRVDPVEYREPWESALAFARSAETQFRNRRREDDSAGLPEKQG